MCRKRLWRLISCCCAYLVCCTLAWGQSDCPEAIVICDDGVISFTPSPFTAVDDFANINNDPGCLITLEVRSVWYYFSFRSDMPPNSVIEFTLVPIALPGQAQEFVDYDFAIYGPDLTCDSLGSPLRCSFARFDTTPGCTDCNDTGLGMGAVDLSEVAVGQDGFVAPMVVQPGQGFYMLIDNFVGDTDSFELTWGGSAKPFLNCITDPACNQLGLVTAPEQAVCADVTEISLTPTITGDNGNVSYQWSGDSLHLLSDTTIQNPVVTVPDGFVGDLSFTLTISEDGCSQSGPYHFEFLDAIAPELLPADLPAACMGDSIDYSLNVGFADYEWSTGDSTRQVRLAAGETYSVTATALSGCQVIEQIEVTAHSPPDVEITGDTSLCDNSTGTLSATDGLSSYLWSTGATTTTINIQNAATYQLSVTDQNGCAASTSAEVQALSAPTASISGPLAICANTSATLELTETYASYAWSTNSDQAQVTVANAGDYSVTVTASNGCPDTAYFALTVHDLPDVDLPDESFFCPDTDLNIAASTQFSSYIWSTGDVTPAITVTEEGVYSLSVTDTNGCTNEAQTLATAHDLQPLLLDGDPSFCTGDVANLHANTGFAAYDWSNGGTNPTTQTDLGGWITLSVTDSNDCVQTDSFFVDELDVPDPQLAVVPALCGGQETEINLLNIYSSYVWSNGSQAASTTFNQTGLHEVTVTNDSGCSASLSFNISEYPEFIATILGDPFICAGSSTTLTTSPNVVSHYWSATDTLPSLDVSQAGTYSLIAQDANGCIDTALFVLDHFPDFNPDLEPIVAICENQEATLFVEDVYQQYQWSTGETDHSIQVSQAGNIGLEVEDVNGCTYSAFAEIVVNDLPVISYAGEPGFCENGSTQVIANGGYATYQWSNGVSDSILWVDQAGPYQVVITTSEGCVDSLSVLVEEWLNPQPNILGPSGFCEGENAQLESDQDFASYLWTGSLVAPQISVNEAGTYGLTVTDDRGCQGETSMVIEQWALPQLDLSGDTSFCAGEQTTLFAVGDFSELTWPDGSQNTSWTTDQTGAQIVHAVNSFGCQNSFSFHLNENPLPSALISAPEDIDCDNNGVTLTATLDNVTDPVYHWAGPGIHAQNEASATPLVQQVGQYSLEVTDMTTGCRSLLSEIEVLSTVELPEPILIIQDTITCVQTTADVSVTNLSGTAVDWRLEWVTPTGDTMLVNSFSLEALQGGDYQLIATNLATSCLGTELIVVPHNTDAPTVALSPFTPLDCEQEETTLSIAVDSDGAPYRVDWTLPDQSVINNAGNSLPTHQAGPHQIRVERLDNGCFFSEELIVEDLSELPPAMIVAVGQLDCQNQPVSLSAPATPAGENWSYAWYYDQQLMSQQNTYSTLESGLHILEVTDLSNGCVNFDTLLIDYIDNGPSGIEFLAEAESCEGANDGSILLETAIGGTAPFQYQLDDGEFGTETIFNQLSPGLHQITVIDDRMCSLSVPVSIEEGNRLGVQLNGPIFIELGDRANLRAFPQSSGQIITSFDWRMDNGLQCANCNDNWQIDGLTEGGMVQVELTDENGCVAFAETRIVVESDYAVYIPNGFSPNADGKNDRFTVFGDSEVKLVRKLIIMDRWGNFIFEEVDFQPNDLRFGWDGTFRGQDSPTAVYAYFAIVEFIDGKTSKFKGDVTLIR